MFVLVIIVSLAAAMGYLAPVPGLMELYFVPAGSAVRPMGLAAAIFMSGVLTPLFVAPLAVFACRNGGLSRSFAALAALGAFVPLPVYMFLFQWIVRAHSLTLKP